MRDKVFALIDCNAFYVSCERVFNPKLNNRPVVALSNNDGCIISRSKEAKALGIKMGVPLFKVKDIVQPSLFDKATTGLLLSFGLKTRSHET